jgi:hypothetical protein
MKFKTNITAGRGICPAIFNTSSLLLELTYTLWVNSWLTPANEIKYTMLNNKNGTL